MISRRTLSNAIAVALVAACFLLALGNVLMRSLEEADPNRVVIRFSHWQVEAGMREAFEAVAEEYEALHPNVRVEQLPCPGTVYGTWIQTRLIGGDPPGLMELGRGQAPDRLARYFQPLTAWLNEPNPYNAGTEPEGAAWRETFLDGLSNAPGLDTLIDYYAVPVSAASSRMYYNLPLFRRIMGPDAPLPETLEQFLAFCRKTRRYAADTGRPIVPVAGSAGTANVLLLPLIESQTQKLALQIDDLAVLIIPQEPRPFLDPRVSLAHPAVRSGLELARTVGGYMPSGFVTYSRDDAIFAFSTGRAVSLAAGSWDYKGIVEQSDFPIALAYKPYPTPGNPEWGRGVLGRPSERDVGLGVQFYLPQQAEHAEQAVDFLRYLTSVPGQRTFVKVSTWPPAVRTVAPAEQTEAFAPRSEGYTNGFHISKFFWGGGDVYRVYTSNLGKLFDPDGSVETFIGALNAGGQFQKAVASDLARALKNQGKFLQRQDPLLAAHHQLAAGGDEGSARKLSAMFENQNLQESQRAWLDYRLRARGQQEGR